MGGPSRKGALVAVSCVALLVIGFSGWSLCEYVQGRDPLAFLSSTDLLQTVVDEPSAESDAVSVVGPEPLAATEGLSETERADTSGTSGSSSGGEAREGVGASGDGGADDASASGSSEPAAPAASAPSQVRVSLSADASAAGGSSSLVPLTLEAGSTVYDALAASGISYNAKGTAMGVYVSSILGVAEKEHGGDSGWVYAVNGTEPSRACSSYELADGDVVSWTYVNVEY
jgi:hypothetical protein